MEMGKYTSNPIEIEWKWENIPIFLLKLNGNGKIYLHFHSNFHWNMIMVIVFLSIMNQMEFFLFQNREERCHHDHIPFDLNGNGDIFF